MVTTKANYIQYAKNFVERIWKGDVHLLERYKDVQWSFSPCNGYSRATKSSFCNIVNHLSKNVMEVVHQNYHVAEFEKGSALVKGVLCTRIKEEKQRCREHFYSVHVVFIYGKITCFEMEPRADSGQYLVLHNTDKEVRCLWEREIIYIESLKGHLYWHSYIGAVETTGTLQKELKRLSDDFVKIHRSYVINKYHVRTVRRCEVVMDNETILRIPMKRYMDIKTKLSGY